VRLMAFACQSRLLVFTWVRLVPKPLRLCAMMVIRRGCGTRWLGHHQRIKARLGLYMSTFGP
jgi:hypothetical protein